MKKLLAIVLGLCLSGVAEAAITAGNHKCAVSSNDNSVTTAAIDTSGATLIVLAVGSIYTASVTPTDSASNTWTCLADQTYPVVLTQKLCYVLNPTTSAMHTFSISSVGSFPGICAFAVNGTKTSSALDQQNGNNSTGGGTTITTGNVDPSENSEIIISTIAHTDAGSLTIGTGLSIIEQIAATAHAEGAAIAYEIQTSKTARNQTWTLTGTNAAGTTIATFKSAAAVCRSTIALMGVGASC